MGLSEPRRRGDREAIRVLLATARRRSLSGPGPSRLCTRWSPAPLTVFASDSGRCRLDSSCRLAPGLRDWSRDVCFEESATVLAMLSNEEYLKKLIKQRP